MSSTQLKLIAGGLLLLLLLWGASALLSRGSDSVRAAFDLRVPPVADVDSISIVKGQDTIAIARQSATDWTVNGHRAAVASVTELLQTLRDTVRPELVAQDSSSFARLQVDSAGGRWLRLRGGHGGKPLLEIIVGTRPTDFQSAYLRRPGDAHVYLWRGPLGTLMGRTLDDWRDKRIAGVAPDSIVAVDVVRGKDRYALTRAGKTWTVNGVTADSGAVGRYLERLKTITAAGFATPEEADSIRTGRLPPARRIRARPISARRLAVRSTRGIVLSLAFDSTAGSFLVRRVAGASASGEGTTVYRMNVWDVDGVTPARRSLLPTDKK